MNENHSLNELSVDSIQFVNIVVELEEQFDVEFDDEIIVITSFDTISGWPPHSERCKSYH